MGMLNQIMQMVQQQTQSHQSDETGQGGQKDPAAQLFQHALQELTKGQG